MSTSILLNPSTWDLLIDVNGNIALASEPYSLAQDVACACKLQKGELYYDTTQGVPIWSILGKLPTLQFIKNSYVAAALTVPTIKAAVCYITRIENRVVAGQVQTTNRDGRTTLTRF